MDRFVAPCRYLEDFGGDDWRRKRNIRDLRERGYTEACLLPERAEEFWSTHHTWEEWKTLFEKYNAFWISRDVCIAMDFSTIHALPDPAPLGSKVSFGVKWAKVEGHLHHKVDWLHVVSLVAETRQVNQVYEAILKSMVAQPSYEAIVEAYDFHVMNMPVPVDTFANFLEESIEVLERVRFWYFRFPDDHCQVLTKFQRSVSFHYCGFEDEGKLFLQGIAEGQGPSELELRNCLFNYHYLYDSLRNSSCGLRTLWLTPFDPNSMNVGQLFNALGHNRCLVKFAVTLPQRITESEWDDLFQALKEHPTLESLYLRVVFERNSADARKRRTRVIADALKVNETLHELDVGFVIDQVILRGEIRPRLKSNYYRLQLVKLAKDYSDQSFQSAQFRSVLANPIIRNDPSLVFAWLLGFRDEFLSQLDNRMTEPIQGDGRETDEPQGSSKRQRLGQGES